MYEYKSATVLLLLLLFIVQTLVVTRGEQKNSGDSYKGLISIRENEQNPRFLKGNLERIVDVNDEYHKKAEWCYDQCQYCCCSGHPSWPECWSCDDYGCFDDFWWDCWCQGYPGPPGPPPRPPTPSPTPGPGPAPVVIVTNVNNCSFNATQICNCSGITQSNVVSLGGGFVPSPVLEENLDIEEENTEERVERDVEKEETVEETIKDIIKEIEKLDISELEDDLISILEEEEPNYKKQDQNLDEDKELETFKDKIIESIKEGALEGAIEYITEGIVEAITEAVEYEFSTSKDEEKDNSARYF